jgi:hypothetical protein
MTKIQFRVLYREFLFRMIDLELLSVHGDMNKLLGQFAAFLVFISVGLALFVLGAAGPNQMPRADVLIRAWQFEHAPIAMTMLVVGLWCWRRCPSPHALYFSPK